MKSNSQPQQSSMTSARPTPRLPVEVIEMCLRFSAQLEMELLRLERLKQIGSLRLLSRRFRDVFTKELFNSVMLCLFPMQGRPTAFLDIVRENGDILKHTHHVTILLHDDLKDRPYPSTADFAPACGLVREFSRAPLRTLTINGLDDNIRYSPIFNALHALRSIRSLQTLNISGYAVPPFLVCGHFSSTRLKSIHLLWDSYPTESTSKNLEPDVALSIGPDSVLASGFQPFAEVQDLGIYNGADVPKYFPLQDFGSTYYPSNGRIPFTLPVLRKLQVGNPDRDEDSSLGAEDYKVLGALLSRAPMLETLCIIDEFGGHDGLEDFTPLLDQLSSVKNLRRLELLDFLNDQGEAVESISSVLGAFPPVHSLTTLCVDFAWGVWNIDATRASLYFSGAWEKLRRALASPALLSLQVLRLDITILISGFPGPPDEHESFGPEEVDGFKETLINLYSRDGSLDVMVNIEAKDI